MKNIKETEFFPKFYQFYTPRRDKAIFWVLRKLRVKAKTKLTSENINEVLRYRNLYERISQAYWDARLAKRPFIITKRIEYGPFKSDVRKPMWNHGAGGDDPYDPPPGQYFLVLDGREYENLITFEIDEDTKTLIARSAKND